MKNKQVYLVLAALIITAGAVIVTGGNLDPFTTPGSTMKTLDQVEARIPIAGNPYGDMAVEISQSGSYYLTGDRLTAPGQYGIHITASNVTLDLNGYTLKEMSSTTGRSGISIDGAENVEIRNGTIRDFPEAGITAQGSNIRIFDVRILNNGSSGISLSGDNNQVRGCTVSGNGSTGIYAWNNSNVSGNTCSHNQGHGIFARWGSVVSGNSCYQNSQYGIFIYSGLVIGNSCYGNTSGSFYNDSNSTFVNNTP